METNEKIDFASVVFQALVTEKMDRLDRGVMLRQQMFDMIQRGETPTGYRAEWLRAQAMKVVEVLTEMAKAFDDKYPDDKCSVSDLTDILATTQGLFRKIVED